MFFSINFWTISLYFKRYKCLANLPIQTLNNHVIVFRSRQIPYGVSFEGVTGKRESFRTTWGHLLSIAIALSILSDWHLSCVTDPASEKGDGPSTTKYFWQFRNFSVPKSSMYWEIGENPVAEGPFPENKIKITVKSNFVSWLYTFFYYLDVDDTSHKWCLWP